jgi:RND family efflux transporter MFP subunit
MRSKRSAEELEMRTSRTALIVALLVSLAGCGKATDSAPPPPEVMVAEVLTKKIVDWDEYSGRFQAIDTVEVRPRVSGYIDKILFREGQAVKQGETLIVIDPRPYQADFDRAKANLVLAKSQLELANLEANRVRKLKESGAVSQEELEERVSTLQQREASVAAAQAALDSAALDLSFTTVRAPISGQASRAEITRGNLVTGGNNGGTLLTTIVSADPIYVYFDGDENAYLRYQQLAREGDRPSSRNVANPVRIGLANEEGFPHSGHMDFVDNQLNVRTGTIRGRAVLDNKQGIFTPGMFARVQLLGSSEHEAILIEERAIGTDQTQNFVLVVGADNKVEYRPVQLGRSLQGLRIVRQGLKSGETIVVNGLQRVRPGVQVTPKRVTMGEGLPQPTATAGNQSAKQ